MLAWRQPDPILPPTTGHVGCASIRRMSAPPYTGTADGGRSALAGPKGLSDTRPMSRDYEDATATNGATTDAFRHLPAPVRLEETVATTRGDSPPEAIGEQNAFIAAALHAGG